MVLTPLKIVRERAREDRNESYYDTMFRLKAFLAGATDVATTANLGTSSGVYYSDPDLAVYPDIWTDPFRDEAQGVQNHALISSRINVQSVVTIDPEITVYHPEPLARDYIQSYFKDRWKRGNWGAKFYEIGMDVEACGLGFAEWGVNALGLVDLRRADPLDILWDQCHRSEGDWDHFFIRDKITCWDAANKYATAFGMDIDQAYNHFQAKGRSYTQPGTAYKGSNLKFVTEWRYWDATTHVVFLCGLQEGMGDTLIWDGESGYVQADASGPNPFGIVPVSTWLDSWAPGVHRPVSKTETTIRTAGELALIERHITNVIRNMPPLNIISTAGLTDPELIAKIRKAGSIEEIGSILVTDHPNLNEIVQRLQGGELSQSALAHRAMLKEEINPSTGVADSKRGQYTPGERTAYEVREVVESGNIQARHTRRQYARFLRDGAEIAKWIGASFDRGDQPLILSDGDSIDVKRYSLSIFLSEPADVMVSEDSFVSNSPHERAMKRLQQYQTVDREAIQMGVADAGKIYEDVWKALGVRDTSKLMRSTGPGSVGPLEGGIPEAQGVNGEQGELYSHLQELVQNAG